ncbi:MAG: transcription-repair coupling factor [bacterium]
MRPHDRVAPLLPGWEEAVDTPFFQDLRARITSRRRPQLAGLPGSLGPLLVAALVERDTFPGALVVVPDRDDAEELAEDFAALLGDEAVRLLPERTVDPYEELGSGAGRAADRYLALRRLTGLQEEGGVVVASASAAGLITPGAVDLRRMGLVLREGQTLPPERFSAALAERGYERVELVDAPGGFAVRGGIVDAAPPDRRLGVRLEFWGDEIESIREFRYADQKTVGGVGGIELPPVREIPSDDEALLRASDAAARMLPGGLSPGTPLDAALEMEQYRDGLEWYLPLLCGDAGHLTDLLPERTLTVCVEPEELRRILEEQRLDAAKVRDDLPDSEAWLPAEKLFAGGDLVEALVRGFPGVDLVTVAGSEGEVLRSGARPTPPVAGDLDRLREELIRLASLGIRSTLLVEDPGQEDRLRDLLGEEAEAATGFALGQLAEGFVWPDAGIAVWPDHEIFRRPRRRRPAVRREGKALRSWRALTPGDLVVHVHHGIGRYEGLRSLELDGVHTELLEILYAGKDKLLVPIDQMDRVQRYSGSDPEHPPQLNTLGGTAWERTKELAKQDLLEMAEDLAKVYAARQELSGTSHPPDDILMEELEASFPYSETPDQSAAVDQVKRDLEDPRPMDRLICGDVGYGKTEVAVRAALKVIEGGNQVAVLVPTTLLAQQHMETFRERLGRFPVRIEVLSRFRTSAQQRRTLAGLARGEVDLVIGTHRLLSRDVEFLRLGLVVVDEEHRFGVKAKERLKRLRTQVDVLSLTATPIPRTLHMSLLNIRDMSIITTPPQDRLPVHTEVVKFEEDLIAEGIQRELDRGGQVFFVHNRVQSIDAAARMVERLAPRARVAIAHGQMKERDLESVMLEFTAGEVDVLVSTMIVESGLDLPNANTLFVNRADRLGLAQLYQLRGRVGRSSQKAHAYFLVPPGRRITRDARRRLQAIQEHTDLGAGFHLAMRDLEIRGAGNLLGPQQHGNIRAVGFDLYRQMLEEAVAEIRGTPEAAWSPPRLELPGDAYLPEGYVDSSSLRVDFYRRAVEARTLEDVAALHEELRDRFGPLPGPAAALLDASALRVSGAELGLDSLVIKDDTLHGRYPEDRVLDRPAWEALMARLGENARFAGEAPLRFKVGLHAGEASAQIREARNRLLTEEEAEYLGRSIPDPSGETEDA